MRIKQSLKWMRQILKTDTLARQTVRRRHPLHLESLEERSLASLLFSSNGPRNVVDLGGPVIQHADVDLIFWGAGWTTGQGPTLQANLEQAVARIMTSPYLSGLSQYRGAGNGQLLRTDLITSTSPPTQLTNSGYGAFVEDRKSVV